MKGQTLGAFVKLVIFAVVTAIATYVLAVTISNQSFGSSTTFKADFTDATALIPGNDVRIAGVRVGTVKGIKVADSTDSDGKPIKVAQVTFNVDNTVPMTTTMDVDIRYQNLVGQRYLALVQGTGDGTPLAKNAVIPPKNTAPALDLTALFNGFRPLFQGLSPNDVNSFAAEIISTLQGETGTVTNLVAKTADLTNSIADRDTVIGQVIDNLTTVLHAVEARDAGLSQTVIQLQRLVSGLAADRSTIAGSLQNIDNLASSSTTLLAGIRPSLPTDLTGLSKVASSLANTKDCPGYYTKYNEIDKKNVPAIPRFANNNCKGPNTLNGFLQREPGKLSSIIRTATYGGYFNFYLCQLQLGGSLGSTFAKELGGSVDVNNSSAACQR